MGDLSIFSLLGDLIPILSSLAPFILAAALWWLRSQFPTKADFDALRAKVDELSVKQTGTNQRLDAMERDMDDPPTRVELLRALGDLGSRVSAMEAQNAGLQRQVQVTNDYLHLLVDKRMDR